MVPLSDSVSVEGAEETAGELGSFGHTIEEIQRQVEQLQQHLGGVSSAMSSFGTKIDESVASISKAAKGTPDEAELAARDAKKSEQEAAQLRSKMAGMIGGGVNTIAYEQNLSKIRDQINAITEAEGKLIVTFGEAFSARTKLRVQSLKLWMEAKAYSLAGGGGLGKIAAMVTNRLTALPGQAVGAVKSQVGGIGTGIMGLINSTPLGHAAGGLFGLLLHGVMNRDRLNAEAGEVANIVSAAGGKAGGEATKFFAGFQEQAQHYFGMSRQEVQGTLKTFVDAGIGLETIMTKQSDSLGLAGKNVATLTLAVDKHFELASGTSARHVVSLMSDYGMEVGKAGDLYTKLAFAGQQSGMGTQNFINAVMQGSGTLRQFGVGVEGVATTLLKLQERYEQMGMPKQLAGTQASAALQGIAQGISSMSPSMQAYMGERMGMGTGLDARMKYRDGLTRLSKGGDDDFMAGNMQQLYKMAMESSGGDKTRARYFLEQQGMGFEGAKGIVEVGEHLEKGGKLAELGVKRQQELKDAFKTEGQKQSDIQKNQYTIMQGMANVGEGLLKILTNFVGEGIVFFKAMPILLMGTEDEKKAVFKMVDEFHKGMVVGAKQIFEGGKGISKGVHGLLKPIIGPLQDALAWNPYASETDTTSISIKAAGDEAERQIAQQAVPLAKMGTALRDKAQDMQKEKGSTAGRYMDDAGILLQGLGTGVARMWSSVAGKAGGTDYMTDARRHAEGLKRQELARENTDAAERAARRGPAPPTKVSTRVTVRPSPGGNRPVTQ